MSSLSTSVSMVQLRSLVQETMGAPAFGPFCPAGELLHIPASEVTNLHALVQKELADISFKISYLKEKLRAIRGGCITERSPGEKPWVHSHLFVPLRQLEMRKWHINIRYGNIKTAYDTMLRKTK